MMNLRVIFSVLLLAVAASEAASYAHREGHDVALSPKLENFHKVYSVEECEFLCSGYVGCMSAVYSAVGKACKILGNTHETGGILYEKNFRTYLIPGTNGCTHPNATNYDSLAIFDDEQDMYCDFSPDIVFGCTDEDANNFDSNANVMEEGSCVYRSQYTIWYDHQLIFEPLHGPIQRCYSIERCQQFCDERPGCRSFTMKFNGAMPRCYTFANTLGEGPYGNMLMERPNYHHASLGYSGCTDSRATNFDSLAKYENDSCIYDETVYQIGCADPLAYNYNTSVDVPDNTLCDYQGDWIINEQVMYIRTPVNSRAIGDPMTELINPAWCRSQCENTMNCIAFNWRIYRHCQMYIYYDINTDEDGHDGTRFHPVNQFWVRPEYWGCTDNLADNFASEALWDDGSCSFPSWVIFDCMNSNSTTFNSNAHRHDEDMCDYLGSWNIVAQNERYFRHDAAERFERPVVSADQEDPWWCRDKCYARGSCVAFNWKAGKHCILFDEFNVTEIEGSNGTLAAPGFVLMSRERKSGCMGKYADNYDQDATEDDGSCIYPEDFSLGCGHPWATNTGVNLTVTDITLCDFTDVYAALYDAIYDETNPTATFNVDDLPGNQDEHVQFCRTQCNNDPTCVAFNVLPGTSCALFDVFSVSIDEYAAHGIVGGTGYELWFSGLYAPLISGCTDSTATNFNRNAHEDDGSCTY